MTSFVPALPFDRLMADALEGLVRSALTRIRDAQKSWIDTPEAERLKSETMTIRFRVDHERVVMPPILRKMSNLKKAVYWDIALDSFFENLDPRETDFSVRLLFNKTWMSLTVPYAAIRRIEMGGNILDLTPHHDDEVTAKG